jgi:hypothetical protein|tara:strand:+ start:1477 stop:1680 length:204 start_codon:yes stop_codon:yes gene_type:complete
LPITTLEFHHSLADLFGKFVESIEPKMLDNHQILPFSTLSIGPLFTIALQCSLAALIELQRKPKIRA